MFKYLKTSLAQGLSDSESEGNINPFFFQIPPPPQKKKCFGAHVLAFAIFNEISEHFAFDKVTCLSIPIHF